MTQTYAIHRKHVTGFMSFLSHVGWLQYPRSKAVGRAAWPAWCTPELGAPLQGVTRKEHLPGQCCHPVPPWNFYGEWDDPKRAWMITNYPSHIGSAHTNKDLISHLCGGSGCKLGYRTTGVQAGKKMKKSTAQLYCALVKQLLLHFSHWAVVNQLVDFTCSTRAPFTHIVEGSFSWETSELLRSRNHKQ